MRAVLDLEKLGQRTLWVDCDVLQADGGTRTAAITGAYVALSLAVRKLMGEGKIKETPIQGAVAAVSVGVVSGQVLLDLNYIEDKDAQVDMNLVMNSAGEFVELQSAGEESTFSASQLEKMLSLGRGGIQTLLGAQAALLSDA